jgi:hypothetical protein
MTPGSGPETSFPGPFGGMTPGSGPEPPFLGPFGGMTPGSGPETPFSGPFGRGRNFGIKVREGRCKEIPSQAWNGKSVVRNEIVRYAEKAGRK